MKVFDLHCDTLSELRYAEEAGQPKSFAENDLQIDLKKLQKGDYMLQCFAAFVNLARPGQDPLVAALEEIDIFKRIMAKYSDFIAPVYQPEDLRKNAEAGKISGMLTIEEGGCCKGSLGVLRLMHELGVRMMTLTWNHENELASPNVVPGADTDTIWPCQPNTKTGLKEKGFEFLAEMERLHIIADVSHLSDNIATNMVIDYLGLDTINACIKELGFAHTVLHNPLHFDRYEKLGTTTPRDYASLFAQVAKGTLVSAEASAEMLAIFRQQHYNTMLTHDFPQFYLDCEETGEPELIWVASKSGSMNACRNDGGIIHTPYGEYVIVLMNKDFHDIIEYDGHPAMVYGARVSRMILDQILACEGKLYRN